MRSPLTQQCIGTTAEAMRLGHAMHAPAIVAAALRASCALLSRRSMHSPLTQQCIGTTVEGMWIGHTK